MVKQVNVHEAKTNLSKLIAEVEAGEEIVIARAGTPIIKLVKIEQKAPKPNVPGFAKGLIPEWSTAEWDQLDIEFNYLFRENKFDERIGHSSIRSSPIGSRSATATFHRPLSN